MPGNQRVEDLPRIGLVEVVGQDLAPAVLDLPPGYRQHLVDHHPLLQHALELVVDELDVRHIAPGERLDDLSGDGLRVSVLELREEVDELEAHVEAAPREEVAALAADQPQRDAGPRTAADDAAGLLDDVGVEPPAQPLVRRHHHEQGGAGRGVGPAPGEEGVRAGVDVGGEAAEHALHLDRERPGAEDAVLRPAEPRGGDRLHGLGDLLGRLDGADASAEVEKGRHWMAAPGLGSRRRPMTVVRPPRPCGRR